MKSVLSILIITALFSCNNQDNNKIAFRLPIIVQTSTKDTIEYLKSDSLYNDWAFYLGKHSFCDTLHISIRDDFSKKDTLLTKDRDYDGKGRFDTLSSGGLEIVADYKSTVSRIVYSFEKGFYFYPVHIVNETFSPKMFIGKDSYVFAIQEALDTNNNWRPIEGRGFDFCGNEYWHQKVNSNEFITFLLPKYKGDFKTKMRVRIKIGENIYVSNIFEGTINYSQFLLRKGAPFNYLYRRILQDKSKAIKYLFYGAEPLETDDENFSLYMVKAN